jgi:hypothetical protein
VRLLALDADADIHCFLPTLPRDENLRRSARRQRTRAIDELELELRTPKEVASSGRTSL